MNDLHAILNLLADGKTLSEEQAEEAFALIMAGRVDLPQMAAFIMALRVRGETVDEIVGGAKVLRAKANILQAPKDCVDTCGTGGDGTGTYNISTAAAIVAAACGVPIAKHGNRSVSSKSGSADVLMALGAELNIPMSANEQSLRENSIAFMFAPSHHQAMRHVAPVRASLGLRSIFNLLGPLANPALAKRQVLGVFDRKWLRPMAEVLDRLGSKHVWVVHGADGLDELTTTGTSYVVELKDGAFSEFEITPEDAGLSRSTLEELKGGDAAYNADAMIAVFEGQMGPYRDIVLLNTAATLVVAGKVETLKEGVALAADALDRRSVLKTLLKWAAFTRDHTSASS